MGPMEVLIVETLEPEVVQWLSQRHPVRYAPELEHDEEGLRASLADASALIAPATIAVNARTLHDAPMLRVVGRVGPGVENIDLEGCARAGVEVIRSNGASAIAEAEFVVGALIRMMRCTSLETNQYAGRELNGATVGLVGMAPAARPLAQLLAAFNARVVGYDPSLHASDGLWPRWDIEPMSLRELMESSDAVCVQLAFFSRYRGLFGERFLPGCKPGQVLVNLGYSELFDESALAEALTSGRIAAAWFDHAEPDLLGPGRPLHGIANLRVTPRQAGKTDASRMRGAWAVARRIDDLLSRTQSMY